MHTNLIYEGVLVNGVDLGGKTTDEVKAYFFQKNKHTQDTTIILTGHNVTATISAKQINFGYDENLLTQQAFSVGRSDNLLSNMSLMLQAYMQGIQLSPAYNYKEDKLNKLLAPLQAQIDTKPVNGVFSFEDGRVSAFQLSKAGQSIDVAKLKQQILDQMFAALLADTAQENRLEIL